MMDKKQIADMATAAGFGTSYPHEALSLFERFAALVAAHEREQCALVCDAVYAEEQKEAECYGFASECAVVIRARPGKASNLFHLDHPAKLA